MAWENRPSMTMKRNSMLKQALREAGLDIYRVSSEEVQLAERVRDNLIMDARVSVRETLVRFSARARQGDFPEDEGETLFNRARKLGEFARSHGFEEARQLSPKPPIRAIQARASMLGTRWSSQKKSKTWNAPSTRPASFSVTHAKRHAELHFGAGTDALGQPRAPRRLC